MERFLRPLPLLLVIYFTVNVGVIALWSVQGLYGLTGDEPHYLMISDALWTYREFDVTQAYQNEFATKDVYPLGLAPAGSAVDVPYAHVAVTSLGVFSFHSPLVGWILAIPFGLFGILGAKIAMVAVGALVVVYLWKFAQRFLSGVSTRLQFISVAVLVFAYPLVLGSTQIYPDILAGGLVLVGLYWLFTARDSRRAWQVITYSLAVSLLPWLGYKFAPAAGIIFVAVLVMTSRRIAAFVPFAVSMVLLAWFQIATSGSVFGVITEDKVQWNSDLLIRLVGLVLDQNQGFLLYQPLLWLGLAFIPVMVRRYTIFGVSWILVFFALAIPVAGHPVWYGGGSFNGRFGWPLALLMSIPTLIGLKWLIERSARVFFVIAALSAIFTGYLLLLHGIIGGSTPGSEVRFDLYNKGNDIWLESYSALFFPLQNFFPAWYNSSWAWSFPVNWVWLAVVAVVLVSTWLTRTVLIAAISVLGAFLIAAGLLSDQGSQPVVTDVAATSNTLSGPGILVQGPERDLRWGSYTWGVDYASELPAPAIAGAWELFNRLDGSLVASGPLIGTDGVNATDSVTVDLRSFEPMRYRFSVTWFGEGELEISRVIITQN